MSQSLMSSIIVEATQRAATTSAHRQSSAIMMKETEEMERKTILELLHKAFELKRVLNLLSQTELQKTSLTVEIRFSSS